MEAAPHPVEVLEVCKEVVGPRMAGTGDRRSRVCN